MTSSSRSGGWPPAGSEFQIDLIAEGHLDELRARLAWSQASRHLFE